MVRRSIWCAVVAAATLWVPSAASAAPIMTVRPSTTQSADPGDTVGWGYDIINDGDGTLFFLGISATAPLDQATMNLGVFDFFDSHFALVPHEELHVDYNPSLGIGLVEMTLSSLLAPGDVVAGQVFVDYLLATPGGGDEFVAEGLTQGTFTLDVSALINSPNPVPEPATMILLGTGALAAIGARRRARRLS